MRLIPLTQGYEAIVDDLDYIKLKQHHWKAVKDGKRTYAYREADGKLIGMHQDVLGVQPGKVIDHRDGNGLNNVRSNLRYATRSQNQANSIRIKPAKAGSQYKGVTVLPVRYVARIKVDGKTIHLGTFATELKAAQAYDAAARLHFREYAQLNLP